MSRTAYILRNVPLPRNIPVYIVYCPSLGYRIDNDTGKRFRCEIEARRYVIDLRRKGHLAFLEQIGHEIIDA